MTLTAPWIQQAILGSLGSGLVCPGLALTPLGSLGNRLVCPGLALNHTSLREMGYNNITEQQCRRQSCIKGTHPYLTTFNFQGENVSYTYAGQVKHCSKQQVRCHKTAYFHPHFI